MRSDIIKNGRLKYLQLCILIFFVFIPSVSSAQEAEDPAAKDLKCWTKEECQVKFEEMGWTWDEDKFELHGPDKICGEQRGLCLPAGQTKAEITIGGQAKFLHFGDYLKTIYNYAVAVGGLIAAIALIFGGFVYLTSAGSSEKIASAKTTIGGALMGLLLLFGSYTLLYTINPDLVRLKLPQVYMIKANYLDSAVKEGDFCRTKGALLKACQSNGRPGEFLCRPFIEPGPTMWAAERFQDLVLVLLSAGAAPGLAGAGAKTGGQVLSKGAGWVESQAVKAGEKYVAKFFINPTNKLSAQLKVLEGSARTAKGVMDYGKVIAQGFKTAGSIKNVVTMGAKGAAKGAMVAGGAGAGLGTSVYIVGKKIYDFFSLDAPTEGYAGLCARSGELANGMTCNSLTPEDCASKRCVDFDFLSGWLKGVKVGICSDGLARSPCKIVTDCQTGLACIEGECSGKGEGETCEKDEDCGDGNKCLPVVYKKYCFSEEGSPLGNKCLAAQKLGEAGACQAGLYCITANAKISPLGYCTDKKINSPCFKNEDCEASFECSGSDITGDDPHKFKIGKCLKKNKKLGEGCGPNIGECGEGLSCVAVGQENKCLKFDGKYQSFCATFSDCKGDPNNLLLCVKADDGTNRCAYAYYSIESGKEGKIPQIDKTGMALSVCDPKGKVVCSGSSSCISSSIGDAYLCVK